MKKQLKRVILLMLGMTAGWLQTYAGNIHGKISDKVTQEPLTGATVQILNSAKGAVADLDGNFQLADVKNGTYSLSIRYIGYKDIVLNNIKVSNEPLTLELGMEPDAQALGEVAVVAQLKKNTDIAMMADQRRSLVVQSGVSAQQISKTQDKDASEVIRRVPGVSIIDEKFVMVRGLSQRYNNVWINGGAVPSSEADSRAFSFDIIPSSQLDNMVIVKSPAPEYPSDFTGGFILINTKDMPSDNSFSISIGGSYNDQTHGKDFLYNQGSATDFLGFDNGLRSLSAGMKGTLNTYPGSSNIDVMNNGFNNDWTIRTRQPLSDLKLNMAWNHRWDTQSGRSYAVLAALNYSNTYKTYLDMENSLFGSYDTTNDQPVYMRKSNDNQYVNDARVGTMLNFTYQPKSSHHRYEWKNIFNQLGKSRYTERTGFNAQKDNEHNMEYYYSSRSTYNTQFTGKHTYDKSRLDWSVGYAYANRNLPDRRLIELNDRTDQTMGLYRIGREYTKLDEHIFSGNVNYQREFSFGRFTPTLKAGVYGERRTRDYLTRQFDYSYNPSTTALPYGFQFSENIAGDLLVPANYGADKLYLQEEVKKTNDYSGNNTQAAGYLGATLPFGALNIYAGVRYEYNQLELITNTRSYEESPISTFYKYNDFFPSLNMTYQLSQKQQLRLAYGKSSNRPEFRELSPAVYYDFDLASNVQGNYQLQTCYVQNVDLRYELYPTSGELVSVALFYKDFKNPIEWTYTVSGGTDLIYSYQNARAATTYGIELDIRKTLDFIGLRNFSWSFNGALIKSEVKFSAGSKEKDRPMQGQSPYLINTGIFYQNPKNQFTAAVLYNRIGKRIVGVGREVGGAGSQDTKTIPNSYEMPRNSFDLSLGKKFGHWEIKANVRDLLAEKVVFQQIENVTVNNNEKEVKEITKSYKPGRNFGLSIGYQF